MTRGLKPGGTAWVRVHPPPVCLSVSLFLAHCRICSLGCHIRPISFPVCLPLVYFWYSYHSNVLKPLDQVTICAKIPISLRIKSKLLQVLSNLALAYIITSSLPFPALFRPLHLYHSSHWPWNIEIPSCLRNWNVALLSTSEMLSVAHLFLHWYVFSVIITKGPFPTALSIVLQLTRSQSLTCPCPTSEHLNHHLKFYTIMPPSWW